MLAFVMTSYIAGSVDDDRDPLTPCIFCQGGMYQNEVGATACIDSTHVCPFGTEEVQSPDRSNARVCRQCNGVTEYQDLGGQTSCKQVSTCSAGTFIANGPTPSADRECVPCDGVTEYQDKSMQSFCIPTQSVCGSGFYESVASTPTSDRTCTPCESGETYQNQSNQKACLPVSLCRAGTVNFRAPTPTQDWTCLACDGVLSYQDQDGAEKCKAVTKCNSGVEFEAVAATASSDARCAPLKVCADDEFQDGFEDAKATSAGSDRKCTPHRLCAEPNEYESQAPTATTDRVCVPKTPCRTNHFEVVDHEQEEDLGEGSGNNNDAELSAALMSTADRVCEKCQRCSGFNEYEMRACGERHDTECAACSTCEGGVTYRASSCSKSADTVCLPCSSCTGGSFVATPFGKVEVGTFAASACTAEHDAVCKSCTPCKDGEFAAVQCTMISDTVCKPKCGYRGALWGGVLFTDADGLCKKVAPCGPQEWEVALPTPESQRVCLPWTECLVGNESQGHGNGIASGIDGSGLSGDGDISATVGWAGPLQTYETVAPTATSDRQCKPTLQCTGEEYETQAPTPLSDRTCTALTICSANVEYASLEATPTTDRVCSIQANVTALQVQRTAAIAKSSSFVVGFVAFLVLLAFIVSRSNKPGTLVVSDKVEASFDRSRTPDYFDFDSSASSEAFWFRLEKRLELLPAAALRQTNPLKATAAKQLHLQLLKKLNGEGVDDRDNAGGENVDGYIEVGGDDQSGIQTPDEQPQLGSPGAPLPDTLPGTDITAGMLAERMGAVDLELRRLALLQQQEEVQQRQAMINEANARAHQQYLAAQEEARRLQVERDAAAKRAAQEEADRKKKAEQEQRQKEEEEDARKKKEEAAAQEEAERKRKAEQQEADDKKAKAASSGNGKKKDEIPKMKAMPDWKKRAQEKSAALQKAADEEKARQKAKQDEIAKRIQAEKEAEEKKKAEAEAAEKKRIEDETAMVKRMGLTKADRERLFHIFKDLNTDGDTALSPSELMDGLHKTDLQEILDHYKIDGEQLIGRLEENSVSKSASNTGEQDNTINALKFMNGMVDIVKEHADAKLAAIGGSTDRGGSVTSGGAAAT